MRSIITLLFLSLGHFQLLGQCPDNYEPMPTDLLTNGTFQHGYVGFTSDYTFTVNDVFPEGRFALTDNPNKVHPHFPNFGDHSTGNSLMLVVNGATLAGQTVWAQTVEVLPDRIYALEGHLKTIVTPSNPADLTLYINEHATIRVKALQNTTDWHRFSKSWVSGRNTTTVTLRLVNGNTTAGGNDFALDDLRIVYCKPLFASLPQDPSFYTNQRL